MRTYILYTEVELQRFERVNQGQKEKKKKKTNATKTTKIKKGRRILSAKPNQATVIRFGGKDEKS